MILLKPNQNSIREKIIDLAFKHVSDYYVLKELLKTKNWSNSFGLGGGPGDNLIRWSGNKDGIQYSSYDEGINYHITVQEIISRANQWVCNYKPGEQLKLF